MEEMDQLLLLELLFKSKTASQVQYKSASEDVAKVVMLLAAAEDNKKRQVAKIKNYVAVTVPAYTDLDFKSHFRRTRQSVEVSQTWKYLTHSLLIIAYSSHTASICSTNVASFTIKVASRTAIFSNSRLSFSRLTPFAPAG